ncbi:MAG: hypothetical protein AAF533_25775 [Acidobacteriota bacterium]
MKRLTDNTRLTGPAARALALSLLVGVANAGATPATLGEQPNHQEGGSLQDQVGFSVISLGFDLDGLGQDDYVVAQPGNDYLPMGLGAFTGVVRVISREDPTMGGGAGIVPIHEIAPPEELWIGAGTMTADSRVRFGQALAVADVADQSMNWNRGQDGRNELIVGCGYSGSFAIFGLPGGGLPPVCIAVWNEPGSTQPATQGSISIDSGRFSTPDPIPDILVGQGDAGTTNPNSVRVFTYDQPCICPPPMGAPPCTALSIRTQYQMFDTTFGHQVASLRRGVGASIAAGHPNWWDTADLAPGSTMQREMGAVWLLDGAAVTPPPLWNGVAPRNDVVSIATFSFIEAYLRGNVPMRDAFGVQCIPNLQPFPLYPDPNLGLTRPLPLTSDWGTAITAVNVDGDFPEEVAIGSSSDGQHVPGSGTNTQGTVLVLDDQVNLHACQGPPLVLDRNADVLGRWNGEPGSRFGQNMTVGGDPTGCTMGDFLIVSSQNTGPDGVVRWHPMTSYQTNLSDVTTTATASAVLTYTPTTQAGGAFLPMPDSFSGGPRLDAHELSSGPELLVGNPSRGTASGQYRLVGVPPVSTSPCPPMGCTLGGLVCGDCDQNGMGPNILDALVAAQISVGLITPSCVQHSACDVATPYDVVNILDALTIARTAAVLPGASVTCCP